MKKTVLNAISKFIQLNISLVFLITFTIASAQTSNFKEIKLTEPVCIYKEDLKYYDAEKSSILRKQVNLTGEPCSNFVVTYIGFSEDAKKAFQHAVDIWAHIIESPVPIRVVARFEDLGANTLGSAGPESLNTIIGVNGINENFWYPSALYEKLLGTDRNESLPTIDIRARFNSEFDFYFGIDGNPPSDKHDFVSIVLHELGHGLGFVGLGSVDGANGEIRSSDRPSIYDLFIVNGDGVSVLDFADPSPTLLTQLTSDNLFSNGPLAVSDNNNVLPAIYAPRTFDSGSSYSHWDESTFLRANVNSLMTPFVANGEAIHDPGPVTLGFFKDMGWSICSSSALSLENVSLDAAFSIWPNPFSNQITLNFTNLNTTQLNIKLTDVKGTLILTQKFDYIGNTITLNNLGSLGSGIYFITISDSNLRITKKIIKY
jgi:hypothetical protein